MTFATPGTRLIWRDLDQWCDCAHALAARRCSSANYAAMERHWQALSVAIVRAAAPAAIERLLLLMHYMTNGYHAWNKPSRGARRGTQWETINVEARNALFRAAQAADRAALGLGHNSRNAA